MLSVGATMAGCKLFSSAEETTICGEWQWVKTQGVRSGSIDTPELSGYTERVLFREDGTAEFYRNDSLRVQLPYTVTKSRIFGSRREVFQVHWHHPKYANDQFVLFPGNDTLHLTQMGTEISHYYYVRSRQ